MSAGICVDQSEGIIEAINRLYGITTGVVIGSLTKIYNICMFSENI
jgi:hypothetical protein